MHRIYSLIPNININLVVLQIPESKELEIFNNINKSVSCPVVYLTTDNNILKNEVFYHLERNYKCHISQSGKPICPNFNSQSIIEELFKESGAVKYLQSMNKFDEKSLLKTLNKSIHIFIQICRPNFLKIIMKQL